MNTSSDTVPIVGASLVGARGSGARVSPSFIARPNHAPTRRPHSHSSYRGNPVPTGPRLHSSYRGHPVPTGSRFHSSYRGNPVPTGPRLHSSYRGHPVPTGPRFRSSYRGHPVPTGSRFRSSYRGHPVPMGRGWGIRIDNRKGASTPCPLPPSPTIVGAGFKPALDGRSWFGPVADPIWRYRVPS